MNDAKRLAAVIATIRTMVPDAVLFEVGSGDQGNYGYTLGDITRADGTVLQYVRWRDEWSGVEDAVREHLCSISWGGVIEDHNGDATILVNGMTFKEIRYGGTRVGRDLVFIRKILWNTGMRHFDVIAGYDVLPTQPGDEPPTIGRFLPTRPTMAELRTLLRAARAQVTA